ncbi:MAG: DHA2 family efflux MFS transporter permease subunit [Ktedonobacteraceae bacterium]
MQVPAHAAQRSGGLPYKWIVAIVVVFGLFMSILDTTIVNIAIPRLQTVFGADLNSVQWVLTGYTLAQGVAIPLTGFFSKRLGLKRFYIIALTAFTLGSFFCGLAWSLPVLITFRILQGLGGSFLLPMSITLLYREFPPQERGIATGFLGVPLLLAPALGPSLGGYIVTFGSWQLIFFINVPIGIVAVILSVLLLREIRLEGRDRFDIGGFVFSAAGLASLLYAFSSASTDGWGSTKVLGFLLGGLLALVIFVVLELSIIRREGQPLLDLTVFRSRSFTSANLANICITFALFGGLFLIPVYLQNLRGLSAYQTGLILIPQALGSIVSSLIGGRLVDRLGVRAVVIPGLLITAFAFWQLSFLSLYTSYGWFQVLLILRGLGIGLVAQPLIVAALAEIPSQQLAQASSINSVVRAVSSSLAVAILATLVQMQSKVHYSHLAEQVTTRSPLGQLLTRLQALFVAHGASAAAARASAIQDIARFVQRQGYVLAIQDAFLLSVGIILVAIFAVFFVRGVRSSGSSRSSRSSRSTAPRGVQPVREEITDTGDSTRDEALLAV